MNTDKTLGVDIGYGFTKTFNSAGEKKFPTAVTKTVPESTFREIHPVIVNDSQFLVGDDAMIEGKGLIETRHTGFVRSEAWLAVLGYALYANDFSPAQNAGAILVMGIPPGEYSKESVNDIRESIKSTTIVYRSKEFSFHNTSIKLIPQGAGIFFHHISFSPEDFWKNVAVIDIGHYTVDMVYFHGGKYVEGVTQSTPLGVSLILDNIKREFARKYHFAISQEQAYHLLVRGNIIVCEEPYALDNLHDLVSNHCAELSGLINNFLDNLPQKPQVGLVGGGGVLVLNGNLKVKYKLKVVNNPAQANSIGYWQYARRVKT